MRFKVLSVGASVYISVEPCNHHLRHIPLAFAHRFQTEVMMFRRVGFNRKKATGSVMRRLLLARTTETTSKTMAAMGSDMWPFSCPSILTRAYTAARSGGDDNTELRNGTREADPNQQPDRPRRDTAAGQAAGAAPADLPGLLCFHGPGPGSTKFPVLLADGMWDFSGLLFGLQHSPQVGLFASGV